MAAAAKPVAEPTPGFEHLDADINGATPGATAPRRGSRVFAGVDIGATKIEVVVAGTDLSPVGQARVATPAKGGAAAVLDAVVAAVGTALTAAPGCRLAAVGVGVPGEVDPADGSVAHSPNIKGWGAPFPLGEQLSAALHCPAAVDNDVRTAMRGEHRLGALRGYENALGVWFGTGVGGALLLDGVIRRGAHGAAGELGHAVAVVDGRKCPCGRRGCLEAYAGRAAMEARARERADGGEKTVLFHLMRKSGRTRVTSGVIARALDKGDKLTNELLNDAIRAAGPVLASAVTVLDVDALVIGGGVGTRLGEPFRRRIQRAMQPHLARGGARSMPVVTSTLGDLGGALGGLVLADERAAQRAPKGPTAVRSA